MVVHSQEDVFARLLGGDSDSESIHESPRGSKNRTTGPASSCRNLDNTSEKLFLEMKRFWTDPNGDFRLPNQEFPAIPNVTVFVCSIQCCLEQWKYVTRWKADQFTHAIDKPQLTPIWFALKITLQMLHVMDNSEPHDLMQNGEYPVQTRQGAGNKYALR